MNSRYSLTAVLVLSSFYGLAHAQQFPPVNRTLADNAALVYWQAFSMLPELSASQKESLDSFLKGGEADEEVAKMLRQARESLRLLRRAMKFPQCEWGLEYERRFYYWSERRGYDLEILHRSRRLARVEWRISEIDDNNSTLAITVYPDGLQDRPVFIRWVPHFLWLKPKLSSYLDSVVRGFEWYVTRGEPVPRNQFGEHPWFSKRKAK